MIKHYLALLLVRGGGILVQLLNLVRVGVWRILFCPNQAARLGESETLGGLRADIVIAR